MIFDIQRAMIWKRASAYLFDVIILGILVVGIAFSMSALLGYDSYDETFNQGISRYEEQFSVTLNISEDVYNQYTPEEKQNYDNAYSAFAEDREVSHAYSMMISLALMITSISILLGYLILEFLVPMLLKNGQSLGKKIFGVGVIRTSGIKINGVSLFIRTILGKFTIETMIPVLVIMLIAFGRMGLDGTILIGVLLIAQVILLFATRNHSQIHDLLADTVVIDIASQMIFDSEEEMIAYKKQIHAEQAARQEY